MEARRASLAERREQKNQKMTYTLGHIKKSLKMSPNASGDNQGFRSLYILDYIVLTDAKAVNKLKH